MVDSKEPIPPGCVAWRADTATLFLLGCGPESELSKEPSLELSSQAT
jgi:hypothetical protein